MSSNLTIPTNAVVNYNPGNASLMEMRRDPVRFPRLNTIPREQAVFEMTKIVTQAYLLKGQVIDTNMVQLTANTLVDELLNDTKHQAYLLSLAEIHHVIKRAILENDIYINPASLLSAIYRFINGEGHINSDRVLYEISKQKEEIGQKRLKESGAAAMIAAYTGEFLRNNKI